MWNSLGLKFPTRTTTPRFWVPTTQIQGTIVDFDRWARHHHSRPPDEFRRKRWSFRFVFRFFFPKDMDFGKINAISIDWLWSLPGNKIICYICFRALFVWEGWFFFSTGFPIPSGGNFCRNPGSWEFQWAFFVRLKQYQVFSCSSQDVSGTIRKICQERIPWKLHSLKLNMSPFKIGKLPKGNFIIFQASIFTGELLLSGRVSW